MKDLIALSFAIYPIFTNYGFGTLNFGFIGAALVLAVAFLNKIQYPFEFPKYFLLHFGVLFFSMIWSGSVAIGLFFVVILLGLFCKYLDFPSLYKWYKRVAIVCCIFSIFQYVVYKTTGTFIYGGAIPGLPLNLEYNAERMTRPTAFFQEPAYCAQYLLPLFAFEIIGNKLKNKSLIILLAISLILISSGNGLVGMIVIAFAFIIHIISNYSLLKKITILSATIISLGVGTFYFIQTEDGAKLLERTNELSGNATELSSGFIRIYRGYYVFSALDPIEKTIGINGEEKMNRAIQSSGIWSLFGLNDKFFNAIQSVMIRSGYLGLIFFLLMLFTSYRRSSYEMKVIIIIYFVLAFIESMYMDWKMMYYLVIPYIYMKYLKSEKMEITASN